MNAGTYPSLLNLSFSSEEEVERRVDPELLNNRIAVFRLTHDELVAVFLDQRTKILSVGCEQRLSAVSHFRVRDDHQVRHAVPREHVEPPVDRFEPALRKAVHVDREIDFAAIERALDRIERHDLGAAAHASQLQVVLRHERRGCDGIYTQILFDVRQSLDDAMCKAAIAGTDVENHGP